jgi:polyhydroxybutyrate depolymerase
MKIKKILLGAVALIVGLPLVALLVAVVWISALDRTSGSIVSSGEEREYLLYVPDSYDPAAPTPLVISLHGGAAWAAQQKDLSGWNRLADENGFIVAYPSGTPQLFNVVRIWRTTPERVTKDVQFIASLIDTLEAAYTIDTARIYVNGMSMGGSLAFALSCALSDRIAAVGMVASAHQIPADWCADAKPVPVMAFHGDADPIVPYEGGPLGDPFNPVKPVYPPVRDFMASWAERNGCGIHPVELTVARDVARFEYPDCAEGAAVVLYTLVGGGHTWPGGKPLPEWYLGATNTSIDATSTLWTFYLEHPLMHGHISGERSDGR